MPNSKFNFILVTYNSDSDDISYDKLYCTKEEAKKYMIHEMYQWIKEQYDSTGDEECMDNAFIYAGTQPHQPVYTAFIQFYDWHVTMHLIRPKKMHKTEVNLEEFTEFENLLLTDGYICRDDYDFNWEKGKVKLK